MKQLDNGKELRDINIDLKFSKLKPLHAEWLVELYNQMSTGQKIIDSAWKGSGITEAMKAGKASFQPLDPFHDIDPIVELDDEGVDFNLREVCNLNESQLVNGCSYKNEDSDQSSSESESEYVLADDFERTVFDAVLDDEDDEL